MAYLDRLAVWLGRIAAAGFFVIVAMMVFEVVARYGFNAPTYWAHEIAGVLAAIAFIFGGAYCMALDAHMRITSFIDARGPRLRRLSGYLSIAAGTVYLSGLAYAAWRMSEKSLFRTSMTGAWDPERSGSSWNSPSPSLIKFALFLGACLFLLVLLRRLVRTPDPGPDRD